MRYYVLNITYEIIKHVTLQSENICADEYVRFLGTFHLTHCFLNVTCKIHRLNGVVCRKHGLFETLAMLVNPLLDYI